MEGPSEFYQLLQAYVVIAIGVLAIIVMFDSKTRRDQESRLALILGHSGCSKLTDVGYLKSEAGKLWGDTKIAYEQGAELVEETADKVKTAVEGASSNRFYTVRTCDPMTDITCGFDDPVSYIEGYGVNESYRNQSYLSIDGPKEMEN